MTDFDKVRAILDAATPTEWHWHTYGHATVRRAAGRVTRALFSNPFHSTDLTWVHTEDEDGPNIALTGNGAKSWDNARAIVTARNLAPELLAVAEAAERIDKTWNAYVEAQGGRGHIGQEHTRESRLEGGCGLCESARYGTEVEMDEYAAPDLRAALDALHAKMKETL